MLLFLEKRISKLKKIFHFQLLSARMICNCAQVVKLVDIPSSDGGGATHAGSSPVLGTILVMAFQNPQLPFMNLGWR